MSTAATRVPESVYMTTWHHRGLTIALACLVLLLLGTGSGIVTAQDERVTVRVDGRPVFRVGPTEELSAEERAERIERRIATLLENPQAIVPARIEPAGDSGDERVITLAGVTVVTTVATDSEDNLTTIDVPAAQMYVSSCLHPASPTWFPDSTSRLPRRSATGDVLCVTKRDIEAAWSEGQSALYSHRLIKHSPKLVPRNSLDANPELARVLDGVVLAWRTRKKDAQSLVRPHLFAKILLRARPQLPDTN